MTSMQRDLVRAVGEARHRAARQDHLVRAVRRARRLERRSGRRAALDARRTGGRRRLPGWLMGWLTGRLTGWWRWSAGVDAPSGAPLLSAVVPPPEVVAEELGGLLQQLADRIVAHGTAGERPALEAVADTARWTAPGAAAALTDWDGTEVFRLRAFGVLHGVVLGVLGDEDRWYLLERLRGGSGLAESDLVA